MRHRYARPKPIARHKVFPPPIGPDSDAIVFFSVRNLGIHPNLLRTWKQRIEAENEDTSLTEDERMETRTAAGRESSAAYGARHIKKSDGLLRERKELRFEFIEKHREEWPIKVMCEVLEVSRSGFYAWQSRPESERSKHHRELVTEMKSIHADRDMKCYGSPRVHKELVARGKTCSENTVAKLMREHGLAAKTRRKYKVTTDSAHSLPLAENVLNREFEQDSPDRVWLADITYIWTLEGWLYLAAVLDAYSRKIVGWSMSDRMQASLVIDALRMALGRRCPDQAASLLHHSDRGSQYASQAFQDLLREHNITCSMSRKGKLLGQRDDGELLRDVEERADLSRVLRDSRSSTTKRV